MHIKQEQCDQYTDDALVRHALREVAFFACLYNRYEARLLRYALRLGIASLAEAEDVLQEAFINVWKHLKSFDPQMPFSHWVYRIVHNQAISSLRKKQRGEPSVDLSTGQFQYAHPIGEETETMQTSEDPGTEVMHILNTLPRKYKEVLVLKFLENMSYEEISDVLQIPEGTVATRINRAKESFRKQTRKQVPTRIQMSAR